MSIRASYLTPIIQQLKKRGYGKDRVKHLISVGGWDASHPNTTHTPEEYFGAFNLFNKDGVFDGLDWDLEGNDKIDSTNNFFSFKCLELMAELSLLLHNSGKIVSMAPPGNYKLY